MKFQTTNKKQGETIFVFISTCYLTDIEVQG